jgi:hypothetical protein
MFAGLIVISVMAMVMYVAFATPRAAHDRLGNARMNTPG